MLAVVNLIIGDVSFISLRHILPKIVELYGNRIEVVMLFKPQFECGVELARKFKGVVLDKKVHEKLLREFLEYVKGLGFLFSDLTYSDKPGKEGNIEYLFHLNGTDFKKFKIEEIVNGIGVRSFEGEFLRVKDQEFLEEILIRTFANKYSNYSDDERRDLKKLVFELLPKEKQQYVRDPEVLIEIEKKNQEKEAKTTEDYERN